MNRKLTAREKLEFRNLIMKSNFVDLKGSQIRACDFNLDDVTWKNHCHCCGAILETDSKRTLVSHECNLDMEG